MSTHNFFDTTHNFFDKMNFLCHDYRKIKEFLICSYSVRKDPWCADEEIKLRKKIFFVVGYLKFSFLFEETFDLFSWNW